MPKRRKETEEEFVHGVPMYKVLDFLVSEADIFGRGRERDRDAANVAIINSLSLSLLSVSHNRDAVTGDMFCVEVAGKQGLQVTRMEYMHGEAYYSVKGYSLYDGLRAAIGAEG